LYRGGSRTTVFFGHVFSPVPVVREDSPPGGPGARPRTGDTAPPSRQRRATVSRPAGRAGTAPGYPV
jgi:hypothetical protein